MAGNFFYDKLDTGTTYWYWIKIVSVNGTVGELIGPASATARPLIADLITQLTGQIDSDLLAMSLKGTLDNISLVNTNLNNEIFDRQTGETSFAAALVAVDAGVAAANSFITTEIASRVSSDAAIAEQINLVAVTLGSDVAAVNTALTADINAVTGTVNAMYTAKVTVNGLVGGFGLANNGAQVEAGFDVDTFWVGRTALNKRKPFIIVGDETFIDQAVINKLTFSKLTDEAGSFIVEGGKVKAEYIDTKGLAIRDLAGTIIFASGTALDYTRVGGTKPPSNADHTASNTAAGISGQGAFATLNQINSGNASTYIADLAVGTLKLANNSVTVSNATSGPSGTISTNLWVPPNQTMRVIAMAYVDAVYLGTSLIYSALTAKINGTQVGAVALAPVVLAGGNQYYYRLAATVLGYLDVAGGAFGFSVSIESIAEGPQRLVAFGMIK